MYSLPLSGYSVLLATFIVLDFLLCVALSPAQAVLYHTKISDIYDRALEIFSSKKIEDGGLQHDRIDRVSAIYSIGSYFSLILPPRLQHCCRSWPRIKTKNRLGNSQTYQGEHLNSCLTHAHVAPRLLAGRKYRRSYKGFRSQHWMAEKMHSISHCKNMEMIC